MFNVIVFTSLDPDPYGHFWDPGSDPHENLCVSETLVPPFCPGLKHVPLFCPDLLHVPPFCPGLKHVPPLWPVLHQFPPFCPGMFSPTPLCPGLKHVPPLWLGLLYNMFLPSIQFTTCYPFFLQVYNMFLRFCLLQVYYTFIPFGPVTSQQHVSLL